MAFLGRSVSRRSAASASSSASFLARSAAVGWGGAGGGGVYLGRVDASRAATSPEMARVRFGAAGAAGAVAVTAGDGAAGGGGGSVRRGWGELGAQAEGEQGEDQGGADRMAHNEVEPWEEGRFRAILGYSVIAGKRGRPATVRRRWVRAWA